MSSLWRIAIWDFNAAGAASLPPNSPPSQLPVCANNAARFHEGALPCPNTTLTYARAHDQIVENDYFRAMGSMEKRLELTGQPEGEEQPMSEPKLETLLTLVTQLTAPETSLVLRLELAERMRVVLVGRGNIEETAPISERRQPDHHPPPSLSILGQ